MNRIEYINYRIKCGASSTSTESTGSPASASFKPGWLWNTLTLGKDPVANAVAEGSKKNYEDKKDRSRGLWSYARAFIPGAEGIAKLLNAKDDSKKGKELGKEKYKDNPKASDAFEALHSAIAPKLFKEKAIRYGLPAAAGIAGGIYGMSKKRKKYKKEDDEFRKIIESDEFKELPEEQQRIILDAMKKRKTGLLGRGLGYAWNGATYGFGSKLLADMPAGWLADRQIAANNRYMASSPEYQAHLTRFRSAFNPELYAE